MRVRFLENCNDNFLASVPLTRQNQAFQVQAGMDLLGAADCAILNFVALVLPFTGQRNCSGSVQQPLADPSIQDTRDGKTR